eukprot:TCALIF_13474-PA protein Name:"Protein of unknown function" AED:0.16 eAED:0.18 QI:0/-1/0/1/-1/1/1/0/163
MKSRALTISCYNIFYKTQCFWLPSPKKRVMCPFSGVTAGSSSFEIISTGGGIYNDLWREMEQQGNWLIPSVQEGLLQTLSDPTFSVFAGREKLIFDSLRLGGKDKLHINKEVFFTKYKAIAMRTGSPLKQPFNHVLQRLNDAGIINKITQVLKYGFMTIDIYR